MCEDTLVLECFAIVFDNVELLKRTLIKNEAECSYTIYLCTLAARRGSYNCFVYLYEMCKNTFVSWYVIPHILISMNINMYKYVESDPKVYNPIWIQDKVFITAKHLNREDFIEVIVDKYEVFRNVKGLPHDNRSLPHDAPLWKRIDTLIKCWELKDVEYDNVSQWMPREMLEDIILRILESYNEIQLSNAVGIL